MAKQPQIIVAGILDTKGEEIKFIADRVRAAGGNPIVLELSVGKEMGWADIPLTEVLKRVGTTPEEVFKMERSKGSNLVSEGGVKIAAELLAQGKLDGMIAFGGSMGTSIATYIMRTLPIGIPKVMLSTMTSGDCRPYVGTKDVAMFYPIAEVGLNKVTRRVLNNAAGAVVGMASAPPVETAKERPLIGCMMFGVTTPCVLHASKIMEDEGYDVMINHAVGSGGRSMEELISDGYIVGMLDITTHEIGDELFGGVLGAGPDRLTAAGLKGIPQVVSVGGLDILNFGPRDTLPKKYEEELGIPGRAIYIHNPTVTCAGITADESYILGQTLAEKLNKATGPTAFCVPLRGWGAVDIAEPDKALGWAGPEHGPVWFADPNEPQYSMRNRYLIKGLKEKLDTTRPNVDVLLVDKHMNQPEFAELMAALLTEMLDGKWVKGSHHDLPYVKPFEEEPTKPAQPVGAAPWSSEL